jgi:hypothetical protein
LVQGGGTEPFAQPSPGMVDFGDMILFVLAAGFLGLAPTWFLLKLFAEKAPATQMVTGLLNHPREPPCRKP